MTYGIYTPATSSAESSPPPHLRQLASLISVIAEKKRAEAEGEDMTTTLPTPAIMEQAAPESEPVQTPTVMEEPFLGNLKEMLVQLCLVGDRDADGQATLQAQSEMLNNLFARTIYRTFHGKDRKGAPIEDYFNDEKMALALQIQKQTAETLRIHSARRYMDSIHHRNDLVPTPLPQTWEQSDHLE